MTRLMLVAAAVHACASLALADSPRFGLLIYEDQLSMRAYTFDDDGGGILRPYYNAAYGNWDNGPATGATTTSPGFDLFDPGPLVGFDMDITLVGARKWVNPPTDAGGDVPAGTTPTLQGLDPADEISITMDGATISTSAPGTLALAENIPAGGAFGRDLTYDIGFEPTDTLYVLDFILSTNAPGVADSGTVSVILAPDGADETARLLGPSLYLEAWLGDTVPAPGPLAVLLSAGVLAARRRRA